MKLENEFAICENGVLKFKPGIKIIKPDMINNPYERWPLLTVHKIVMSDDVEEIGHHAFSGLRNLKEVVFSKSLKTISSYAFEYTGIENIKIPDNVKNMRTGCFAFSKIRDIKLPENLKHLGGQAFYRCENLDNVIVPKGVQEIHEGCFARCDNLKNIEFLGDIETFDRDTFYECRKMQNFVFPESTKCIGACMFSGCENLESVVINGPVKSIPIGMFAHCYSLKSITLPSTIRNIDDCFELGYDVSKLNFKYNGKNEYIKKWAQEKGIKVKGISEISGFLNLIKDDSKEK